MYLLIVSHGFPRYLLGIFCLIHVIDTLIATGHSKEKSSTLLISVTQKLNLYIKNGRRLKCLEKPVLICIWKISPPFSV